MLTIEQLRAMPPDDRVAYLALCARQLMQDEERADEFYTEAAYLRNQADIKSQYAATLEASAEEARAYLATLEAAGLWPMSGAVD